MVNTRNIVTLKQDVYDEISKCLEIEMNLNNNPTK